MKKILYCIRHGYALHNKLFNYIGTKAYTEFQDTPLLHEGISQAKNLGNNWKDIDDIELVIVSPCLRTLETAKHIFRSKNKNMIAKDFLIEYPLGIDICNKRKNVDNLKYLYPYVDFNEINDNELPWPDKKETIDGLKNRINEMFAWISKRPEKKIAIVSHSSFIGQFKDNIIGDEDHELKHCYPYKIIANYDNNKKLINFNELRN